MSNATVGSSSTVSYTTATSVSSSALQSSTSPVSTVSAQSASDTAVISSAVTSSVQATATANGNAAAMGSMHISGSPGAVFGAVGSIGQLIINPVPNSSSSTATTAMESKDRLHDVQTALCKFYSRQNNIANSIDGKEFPIIKVQLSLVTERSEEKNTRDTGLEQDSKDTKTQPNTDKYHEDWYRAKQGIEVEQLFELIDEEQKKDNRTTVHKLVNKVRLVGPAGIGKTTFTQYVAYKWATADLWKDRFKYLFWIRLRNLINYTNEKNITLADILFNECLPHETRRKAEVENIKNSIETILVDHKEKTLIVLDGYDEITGLAIENPIIKRVFNELTECQNIILTSRPYRLDGLQKIKFDRKLENCGFSSEQIIEYVDNYFAEQKDRATTMKAWLESREMVMGLAHIPVNLNILCALSKELLQPKAQVSQTSTDTKDSKESKDVKAEQIFAVTTTIVEDDLNLAALYRKMVGYLLHKHYLISTYQLTEDDLIDTNGIETKCSNGLSYLGKVAFKALCSTNPTLIKADLFTEVDKECEEKEYLFKNPILRMVFLRAIDNSNKSDIEKPYEFLHFSFQEFLVARYLVQLLKSDEKSVETARKFFRMEKYNPNYYMVFNFAAGLVHLENETILQAFWQELLNEPKDLTGMGHINLMMRCLDACMLDKRIPNLDDKIKEIQSWLRIGICDKKLYDYNLIFSRIFKSYFIPGLRSSSILFISYICNEIFIKALLDRKEDARITALRTIGEIGDKAATLDILRGISTALEDKKKDVRSAALYAIKEIGEKAATPEILEWINTALNDKEKNVKEDALSVIISIGATPETLRLISTALVDKEADIRKTALDVISKICGKVATSEILRWLHSALDAKEESVKKAALDAIGKIGEKTATPKFIRLISTALEFKEKNLIELPVTVADKNGEKPITVAPETLMRISTALGANEEYIRTAALDEISIIGESAATPEIMQGISAALEAEKDVIEAALDAINGIGEKAATPEILSGISTALGVDEDDYIREAALYAIKSIGAKAATPEILSGINTALKSTKYAIRKAALYAIRSIGEKAAVPEILSGITQDLDTNNKIIRETAFETARVIKAIKMFPEILAKIIFNLKIDATCYGLPDSIINYLLPVSLNDLLSKYLNEASPILLYIIANLALFQDKAITITNTDIQIYDSRQTDSIPLPTQADIKEQRITALKQAFALDGTSKLNSTERLLKIATANENYTQTVSSAASSSSSSFFSSRSVVVSSSSNSLTTSMEKPHKNSYCLIL